MPGVTARQLQRAAITGSDSMNAITNTASKSHDVRLLGCVERLLDIDRNGGCAAERLAVLDTIREIAGDIRAAMPDPRATHPTTSANIIAAIRQANTGADLADAWRGSQAMRLDLPAAEQMLVVMAWIDQAIALAMDDGR